MRSRILDQRFEHRHAAARERRRKFAWIAIVAKFILDPLTTPIESIAGEAAIGAERTAADWLRARFAAPPAWQPEHSEEQRQRAGLTALVDAAVLVPIVLRGPQPTLLFTQRTAHLSNHAGQVSFPGGRSEPDDGSPVATALRETEEEIGLDRRHVEIIGALPEYLTGTGYRVMPVVGLVAPPFSLTPDPREVDEIFEVPLLHLMNGAHHERRTVVLPDDAGRRIFYTMPYERHVIWGATAGMLRNLFHFLRA